MATIKVTRTHAGNLAIEGDRWIIPNDEAKVLRRWMKNEDPWHYDFFGVNRAVLRAKGGDVVLYSALMSTTALYSAVYQAIPGANVNLVIDPTTDRRDR